MTQQQHLQHRNELIKYVKYELILDIWHDIKIKIIFRHKNLEKIKI